MFLLLPLVLFPLPAHLSCEWAGGGGRRAEPRGRAHCRPWLSISEQTPAFSHSSWMPRVKSLTHWSVEDLFSRGPQLDPLYLRVSHGAPGTRPRSTVFPSLSPSLSFGCASWPQETFTHRYLTLKRTMPRSFLVKKYFAKQKPNYSELECQNGESKRSFIPMVCLGNQYYVMPKYEIEENSLGRLSIINVY